MDCAILVLAEVYCLEAAGYLGVSSKSREKIEGRKRQAFMLAVK